MEIWHAFLIGFLGSFHCIGMCGPIAIALPAKSESNIVILLNRIAYNFGRITTYSIFGLVFGLFSKQLVLAGIQQYVSIGLGVIILLSVLLPRQIKNWFANLKPVRGINNFVKNSFANLLKSESGNSFFLFGIINGFLPCGFVYVALAGAVTTGGMLPGMIFMFLFGLGTIPAMLAASMVGKFINVGIRQKINKLIPVFAIILAAIFILRGLNLGIPYLSPKLSDPQTMHEHMHH